MGLLAEPACPSVFIPLTAPLPGGQMVWQEPADGFHINKSRSGRCMKGLWEELGIALSAPWVQVGRAGLFQGSLWSHQGVHVSAHILFIQSWKGPRC